MIAAPLLLAMALVAAPDPEPHWAFSLQLPSLLAGGVALQVERYLGEERWSLAVALGARSPDSGNYEAAEGNVGFELRRWLWNRGPWASRNGVAPGGLFAFAREDLGYLQLRREGHLLGDSLQSASSLGVGYRLLPLGRLELTPSVGGALLVDRPLSSSAPPSIRPRLHFGLTAGLIF